MPKGEREQRKQRAEREPHTDLRVRTFTIPSTNLKPEAAPGKHKNDNLIPLATGGNSPKQVKTQSLESLEVICGDVIQLK